MTGESNDRRSARPLFVRVLGALALRPAVYAEVAADVRAGLQCAIVVMIGAVFEAASSAALHGEAVTDGNQIAAALVASPIGWLLWSVILWIVAGALDAVPRDFAAVMRAIGLAHAPGLVVGFALIPGLAILTGTLYLAALVWFAAALLAAVRGLFGVTSRRGLVILGCAFAAHETFRQGLRLFGVIP